MFIILSARTRGLHCEAAYRRLRRRFPTWEAVKAARVAEVERVIHHAGLSRIKARQIKGMLSKIASDFGDLSGRHLRTMPTEAVELYLARLPGVGLKTARCTMMYSLDRAVFPVDTHCLRLFFNLGLISQRMRFEYAQDALQNMVPPEIRRTLHVNAVAHGRQTCVPSREQCPECVLLSVCEAPRNAHRSQFLQRAPRRQRAKI